MFELLFYQKKMFELLLQSPRSNAQEQRIEEHDLCQRPVSKAAERIGSRAAKQTGAVAAGTSPDR